MSPISKLTKRLRISTLAEPRQREGIVHDDGLGVEHARLVGEHAGAGADELSQVGAAGEVGDGMVGPGGQDEGDGARQCGL